MRSALMAVTIVALTMTASAQAGGPPVMYAVVEKVVLEPNGDAPDRIQIWGSFVRGEGDRTYQFGKPVHGYLYLSIDPAKKDECLAEWAKWKKAVGTGRAVTIGHCDVGGSFLKATIHKSDARPDKPDQVYSVEMLERFGDLYGGGHFDKESHVKALLSFAKERQREADAGTARR
jgi:hypothetical protein